jgi:hypothetical protein
MIGRNGFLNHKDELAINKKSIFWIDKGTLVKHAILMIENGMPNVINWTTTITKRNVGLWTSSVPVPLNVYRLQYRSHWMFIVFNTGPIECLWSSVPVPLNVYSLQYRSHWMFIVNIFCVRNRHGMDITASINKIINIRTLSQVRFIEDSVSFRVWCRYVLL